MHTLLTGQTDTGNTDLPHCMDSIAYQSSIAFWESDEEETFEGAGLSQRPLWDQARSATSAGSGLRHGHHQEQAQASNLHRNRTERAISSRAHLSQTPQLEQAQTSDLRGTSPE